MADRSVRTEAAYPSWESEHANSAHKLFDVTCVIGSVFTSANGTVDPTVAAFQLIGEHAAPGVYSFPLEDGRTVMVDVTFSDASKE